MSENNNKKVPITEDDLTKVAGGMMFFEDKIATCRLCGKEFIINAGEQEYYAELGKPEPDCCKECRNKPKPVSGGFEAVCAHCGRTFVVPFAPVEGRTIYCQECFADIEASRGRR